MMNIRHFFHYVAMLLIRIGKYIFLILLNIYNKYFLHNSNENLEILYRSSNFVIVKKPYDMFINSNNPNEKRTVQSELRQLLPELANPKLGHDFHFVHRLDYATSGIMCIALNKQSAQVASAAFHGRQAKKYYLALVHGHVHAPYLIINKAIGDDKREKNGNHKMCTSDSIYCEKPRDSCTILWVLQRGFRKSKPATKVLLYPGTGRRHQLRVHCCSIGHTVIGDYTYSDRKDIEPHRTFLHSFRLILNTDIEHLDVRTNDPFDAADPSNYWIPRTTVSIIDESIFSEIAKLIQ